MPVSATVAVALLTSTEETNVVSFVQAAHRRSQARRSPGALACAPPPGQFAAQQAWSCRLAAMNRSLSAAALSAPGRPALAMVHGRSLTAQDQSSGQNGGSSRQGGPGQGSYPTTCFKINFLPKQSDCTGASTTMNRPPLHAPALPLPLPCDVNDLALAAR